MQITYNAGQLDNILLQLYYVGDRATTSLRRFFDGYRSDWLGEFKAGRHTPQTRAMTAVLVAAEHVLNAPSAYIYVGKRSNPLPEGAFVGGEFAVGTATWRVYAMDTVQIGGLDFQLDMDWTGLRRNVFTSPIDTAEESTGLTFERNSNIVIIRPDEEQLALLPAGARPFALRIATVSTNNSSVRISIDTENDFALAVATSPTNIPDVPDVATMINEARLAYRTFLRATLNRPAYDAAEVAAREQARRESAERFAAFARRTADTEQHVGSLPFVPHGLSSSRRWGIEVESGGARGVNAPAQWTRTSDGSLRSAYDGWVEVQDFEPHDEEVTEYRPIRNCTNANRHVFEVEVVGNDGRWTYGPNPNYMDPADCEQCGEITRIVHMTPQTITHSSQSGDCAEFVSPILVSMHSTGLEAITSQLATRPQNSTAGVHVHVEASDLSEKQVATLIFGYDILEPLLEASYRREERRFCLRREADTVLGMARKLRPGAEPPTRDEVRGGNRYVTLNTTALNAHGTIEFRAMGPVYEYDYLVRWAMLCRELVNLAAAGVTVQQFSRIKSWNDLLMLLAEYGKEYVRAATYELTGETGHAADLVKQGADMTTEALDEDLSGLVSGTFTSLGVTARWTADIVNRLTTRSNADLVGVGSPSVSDTWAA